MRSRWLLLMVMVACGKKDAAPEQAKPAAPHAADKPAAPAPTYLTLATTASGKALFTTLASATTPEAALGDAVHGLAGFDAPPKITGAFADQQGKNGGASFTGAIGGKAVKGSAFFGLGDHGASVVVVYADAAAPAAEWTQLADAVPVDLRLQETALPGGVGSVSIPAGWKLAGATAIGSATIEGPAGQRVLLGGQLEVITPDSQMAQMIRQTGVTPQVLIAPFASPEKALASLSPQLNRMAKRAHLPTDHLDEILETSPMQPGFPNGKAVAVYYRSTVTDHGVATPYRTRAQLESYAIGGGGWALYVGALMTAPDATFDRDLPALMAVARSWKLDDTKVAAASRAAIAASNRRFEAFEASMRAQSAAFDSYLSSVQNAETVRESSTADFDEVIRGYREIEDTTTGERTTVDLGSSTDVVDHLNEHDPGRYREIPLRDQ